MNPQEALLQSALDEIDPTPTTMQTPRRASLLSPHVASSDAGEAGDSASAEDGAQSPSAWLFRPTHAEATVTTAAASALHGTGAHLFSLTRSMLHLEHGGGAGGSDIELGSIDERGEEHDRDDSGDLLEPLVSNTLASHARSILQHRTPEKSKGDQSGRTEAASSDGNQLSPTTLQERMAFLRDMSPSKLRLPVPLSSPDLPSAADEMTKALASEYQSYEDWFRVKKLGIRTMFGYSLFVMIPAVATSSLLFYVFGNPPCQVPGDCEPSDDTVVGYLGSASVSWWILFLCCRQLITAMLGKATADVLVEYLALQSTWSLSLFGPHVTLFVVLARGWPVWVFLWGLYDILLLYGKHSFAQHWLFYQDVISMMNDNNPDGGIPGTTEYLDLLIIAMVLSVLAAAKRLWLGLVLGRNTYRELPCLVV